MIEFELSLLGTSLIHHRSKSDFSDFGLCRNLLLEAFSGRIQLSKLLTFSHKYTAVFC